MVGDKKWYHKTLKERCVQEALNNYLGDYAYLDGYNPSQIDVKVYQTFIKLDVDFIKYPHLQRWYKHIASFSAQEQSAFRVEQGKILPQCSCKVHNHNNRIKKVSKETNVDLWMLSRVSYAVNTCDKAMAQYDFPTATTACYNLWLYDLCDIYLVRIL